MKNLISLKMSVLISSLIVSCSNLPLSPNPSSITPEKEETQTLTPQPDIPFNPHGAFYPLRVKDGKIIPSYSAEICIKKFLGICTKKQVKIWYFDNLGWFKSNDFGLIKRPKP